MAFPFQQQQQQLLFTKDSAPAGYNTKWEDLHPDSQKLLLQIEERILAFKDESQRIDQCSRLYDSSGSGGSFEIKELGIINNAIEREKVSVQEMVVSTNKMMQDTDFAVRSYMMLRQRFLRLSVPAANQANQLAYGSVAPFFYFYSGLPKRPSFFMEHTVDRFQKYLIECCQWIEEVEKLIIMDSGRRTSNSLEALPEVISNAHDFFIHVAAKVENLHQYVESMKAAFLADRRQRGIGNDPFLEANRREAAKQEDSARVLHPTLHSPAISAQSLTQVSGAFVSSAASGLSNAQSSAGTSAASSGGGVFSLFSTPSSAPAPASSFFLSTPTASASASSYSFLLSTPTASAPASSSSFFFFTPTASAPSSTLFGTSGFTPQSSAFGSPSASRLGSAQGPSRFTVSTPFGSNPAVGSSSGLMPRSLSFGSPSASRLDSAQGPSRFTISTSFGSNPAVGSSSGLTPRSLAFGSPSASRLGSAQAPSMFTTSTPFGSNPAVGSSSGFTPQSSAFGSPSASRRGSAQSPRADTGLGTRSVTSPRRSKSSRPARTRTKKH